MIAFRRHVLPAICALGGAWVFTVAVMAIAPLAWIEHDQDVIRARAELRDDLEKYRAHPLDFQRLETLRWGTIAYEDRAYFDRWRTSPPISVSGLIRAVGRNLRGIREGGSTIPAQVAKMYLRDRGHPGLSDKVRELLFATWMVREVEPDEVLGLYLNLSASRALGQRDAANGLEKLSLALFGLPLGRLDAVDQLVIASTPRGIRWLRSNPMLSLSRVSAAKAWLIETDRWRGPRDAEDPAPEASFDFVGGWRDMIASAASNQGRAPDVDLALAADSFRDGLRAEIEEKFPTTAVQAAFAIVGAGGTIVMRSGSESATMRVNYGSIAKLEPLVFAVEAFGPDAVRAFELPPARCVRWFWSGKSADAGRFCPTDVSEPTASLSFDRVVAQSINTMTARHVAVLPYRLWMERPSLFQQVIASTSVEEKKRLDSESDRAVSANILQSLGVSMVPDVIGPELSYSAVETSLFRYLNARRERAGLPASRLPEDPTQSLGNSSRATVEQIARYAHRTLFAEGGCALSDAGALLALHRKEGTLRWLAAKKPKLLFAGKTGTSPHDDSAVSVVGVCLDGRPVVIAAGVRPITGKLPQGFHGSTLLRGVASYLTALSSLERTVSSPELPGWAVPAVEPIAPSIEVAPAIEVAPSIEAAPAVTEPVAAAYEEEGVDEASRDEL